MQSSVDVPHGDETSTDIAVLYENSELVVINKPPHLPMDITPSTQDTPSTDPTVSSSVRSVEEWANNYMITRGIFDADHAALERAQKRRKQLKFVHQLDAATSGVLCLAFSKSMASRLAHCFEAGTAEKHYVAVVAGHVPDTRCPEKRPELLHFVETLPVLSCMADASTPGSAEPPVPLPASTEQAKKPPMNPKSGNDLGSSATVVEAVSTTHCADQSRTSQPQSPSGAAAAIRLCLPVGYDPLDVAHFRMAVGPLVASPETPLDTSTPGVEWRRRDRYRPAETVIEVISHGFLFHEPTQTWWPVTTLRLSPKTGRRHQLRVHCHALGHPIVGDTLYASQPLVTPAMAETHVTDSTTAVASAFPTQGWPRMYLHAQSLRLPCGVEPSESEAERVALKKRRRRETLGLEATVSVNDAEAVSVFETAMPFTISPTRPS